MPASQFQGRIAGINAGGGAAEFGGIPRSNTLKILDLDVMSIGEVEAKDGSYQVLERDGDGRYNRFLFHDGCLVGGVMIGDTSRASAIKAAIEGRQDMTGLLRKGGSADQLLEIL